MLRALTLTLGTLMLATLAGCAPAQQNANVATAPSRLAITSWIEPSNVPAGRLACKTKDEFGVVTELYQEGGTGTLRRLTPSGMNEEESLRLERSGDALIGDRPAAQDLAVHAVTLRQAEGKKYLRLGDWHQSWSACL